jgi:hypothetical protein
MVLPRDLFCRDSTNRIFIRRAGTPTRREIRAAAARITLKGPDIGLRLLGPLGSGVAAVYVRRRRQASFA